MGDLLSESIGTLYLQFQFRDNFIKFVRASVMEIYQYSQIKLTKVQLLDEKHWNVFLHFLSKDMNIAHTRQIEGNL